MTEEAGKAEWDPKPPALVRLLSSYVTLDVSSFCTAMPCQ